MNDDGYAGNKFAELSRLRVKQAKTTKAFIVFASKLWAIIGPKKNKVVMDIVNQEGGLSDGRIPHSLVAVESQLHAATDEKIKLAVFRLKSCKKCDLPQSCKTPTFRML